MHRSPMHRNPVIGRVLEVFALLTLLTAPWSIRAGEPKRGIVTGRVELKTELRTKPARENVVVWLENVPGERTKVDEATLAISQRDKRFTPALSVVTTGTTVSFPNDDHVFHNVFSLSKAIRFDLGLYKSGTSKQVTMSEPGVVDVYCNIHPEMAARVLVRSGSHHVVVDREGRFRLPEVPPGTYAIVAWHPGGGEWRGSVTVSAGKTAELEIRVQSDPVDNKHVRKDGTPYGRYK